MANVSDVAKYLLKLEKDNEGDGISNLKLQKLAYYAQGFYGAIHDEPLFEDDISAWVNGPVVPALYNKYKNYEGNPIPCDYVVGELNLSKKEEEIVNEVYEVFGQFSAWKLRNMTHEELPWKKHAKEAEEIPFDEIKEYFKTRV